MCPTPKSPITQESILEGIRLYLIKFGPLPPKQQWSASQYLPSKYSVVRLFKSWEECLRRVPLTEEEIYNFLRLNGRDKIRKALNGSSRRKG